MGRVDTVMQSTCITLRGKKGVEQGQVQCKKLYSFACVMQTVMFSTMAKGRTPWGRPHFRWSDTVKVSLVQAGPPAFETWSVNVHNCTMAR